MAHDIDEVWDLCKDIKGKVKDIEEKIDSMILANVSEDIWKVCDVCKGLGYHEVDSFSGDYPSVHTVVQQTCWQCNGTTRVKFGEQKPSV